MSDSAFIMITMTYALPCETARFAWRNGPSAVAGFSGSSLARNETTLPVFDWWRRCERASDLKVCPQKLRKGALKPLKQLVHVNLCVAWEALSSAVERRSLQSPPRFAPPVELPYPGEAALLSLQRSARRQDMPSR